MDENIVALFKKQVKKNEEKKVIIFQNWWVTYKELDDMSDCVARFLKQKNYEKDSIVGIMVPRSIEMIIYIIGVLKAGLAYLPIDPAYPVERVKYMLEDIETNNTKKIANIILNEAVDNNFGVIKDDMSIIVCKFLKK